MATASLTVRDAVLNALRQFLLNAVEWCTNYAERYFPIRRTEVFLRCIRKALEPIIERMEYNQEIRYLLHELGISPDEVLGVSPAETATIPVPAELYSRAAALASALGKKVT